MTLYLGVKRTCFIQSIPHPVLCIAFVQVCCIIVYDNMISSSDDANADVTEDSGSDSEDGELVLDYESDSDAEVFEAGNHMNTFLPHTLTKCVLSLC